MKDIKIKNYPTMHKLEIKNKYFWDHLKCRESVRILLALTTKNELSYGDHIHMQLNAILKSDYDDIVILDDGSTDGTWDVLQEYTTKDTRIHIFRNKYNSILTNGRNRWITLVEKCALYKPTWIHFRACDQLHSKDFNENMRDIVEFFHVRGVRLVKFPLAHLWRSLAWFRYDDVWQKDVENHTRNQLWRYYDGYQYPPRRSRAFLHLGGHLPSVWAPHKGAIPYNVNLYYRNKKLNGYWRIVVLHYGHTSHEKKEYKFRWTMAAAKSGFSIGCPDPANMPHPRDWLYYNGYKGFHEFNLHLKKAPQFWFDQVLNYEIPKIQSFYNVINEYRSDRAVEYQHLFDMNKEKIPIIIER